MPIAPSVVNGPMLTPGHAPKSPLFSICRSFSGLTTERIAAIRLSTTSSAHTAITNPSLETIKANRDALLDFASRHFAAAIAIAFTVYVAAVALSLPGALVLSLAFLAAAAAFATARTDPAARRLLLVSVLYLPAILAVMLLDRVV